MSGRGGKYPRFVAVSSAQYRGRYRTVDRRARMMSTGSIILSWSGPPRLLRAAAAYFYVNSRIKHIPPLLLLTDFPLPPLFELVAWLSGRTSVSGRRTSPVLRSTCS